MARPANLAEIGREGFDLLEKTWGHRRRPTLATQPCVYNRTEVPLITHRLPAPVVSHPMHQYQQPGYPSLRRSEVPPHHHHNSTYHHRHHPYPPAEDDADADADAMDSNKAAVLFRGTKIVEYRQV